MSDAPNTSGFRGIPRGRQINTTLRSNGGGMPAARNTPAQNRAINRQLLNMMNNGTAQERTFARNMLRSRYNLP